MFDNLGPWTWIILAWGQLLLAYGIYLVYMWRLEKRIREGGKG